jgi:hypothetical protein
MSKQNFWSAALLVAALPALLAAPPAADAGPTGHPVQKRPVDVPARADLSYRISARQHGFSLGGEAQVSWRVEAGRYRLQETTRASLLGRILEHRSEGRIDDYGIAPRSFFEKRFRKDPATTTFDRDTGTISFSEGDASYPLRGGEQDRATAVWQLASFARAAPDQFKPGSEWSMFVAGRHDAETWTFKVVGEEPLRVAGTVVAAVHLVKTPPSDSKDQTVDLWLAPSMGWAPVRIRFADSDQEFVDQVLARGTMK